MPRAVASPTVLLLVALTVQVALGGPVLAAAVRYEVAAEQGGIRRLSCTFARAIQSLVLVAPVSDATSISCRGVLSGERVGISQGRSLVHTDRCVLDLLIDLPPPSIQTA